MFAYTCFIFGDYAPSVAPFYVTSKVRRVLSVSFYCIDVQKVSELDYISSFPLTFWKHFVLTVNFVMQVSLALSGLLILALSILGSIGLFSALGVKSILFILEVMPFVVFVVRRPLTCHYVRFVRLQVLRTI